jgi:hypothetical protein
LPSIPYAFSLHPQQSFYSAEHHPNARINQTIFTMQFSTAILALAAGASVVIAQANPALCGSRVAQCCELDVLDLAAITCENREYCSCLSYMQPTDNISSYRRSSDH